MYLMQQEDFIKLEKKIGELLRKPNKTQEAEIAEKEKIRLKLELAFEEDEKPLVDDLRSVGVKVFSVWDLVNTSKSYVTAIPVLIKHLRKQYYSKNKEGIVRALAVKEAIGVACETLITEYHAVPKEEHFLRWAFGNTMAVIITRDYIDEVIKIVLDQTNGDSRQMFVTALSKFRSSKVDRALQMLLTDPSEIVKKEAEKVLRQ